VIDRPFDAWTDHFVQRLRTAVATDGDGARMELEEGARRTLDAIARVGAGKKKVLLVGNGGSAAIVSHVQSDLCKSVGVRALVFHETPLLTAITNDDGYPRAFETPVDLWAEPGDLLVAVSSSGQSESILRPVRLARARGLDVVTLSGFDADNPLRATGMVNFWVDSREYGIVESIHVVLLHHLTDRASAGRPPRD
jgi:D-sedoheptulose 7-phosphate isomerase